MGDDTKTKAQGNGRRGPRKTGGTRTTKKPQLALDELVIEDADLVGAVQQFDMCRKAVATASGNRDKALDKVKKLIPADTLARMSDEQLAIRVGAYRIAMHDIKGGHRAFDTKDRQVMRISPAKE